MKTTLSMVLTLAAAMLACGPGAASANEHVGWILPGTGGGTLSDTVQVVRGGNRTRYDEGQGLRACDTVELVDPKATATVVLINGMRTRLGGNTLTTVVPCYEKGVSANLMGFLKGLVGTQDHRRSTTMAASKSFSVTAAVPNSTDRSTLFITAGNRALYLAWTDGEPPFSIGIGSNVERKKIIVQVSVNDRFVTLPQTEFTPGRYVLTLRDGNGRVIKEMALQIIPESALPEAPNGLASAPLSDDAKAMFYADWLTTQGDDWTLEAMQRVAAFANTSAPARAWLKDRGG